ncbi:MAG: Enoyl-CoA hydratase/isomerase [Aeromicrobium sp.]|nr:Enoyl-CoA hydratase/isomerase [Aeromicrobium sp.]
MTVTTERRGHTLLVTINRPAKRNAIDAATTTGIDAALNELEDDPALRVGVLTGTSDLFSAGTDLAAGPGAPTARGGEYGVIRRRASTPLIAAVEGVALGGGMEIVMASDLVVAGRSATFGLPEAARGVIATCGGLFRPQRELPPNIARQLLLTGRPLDAERAYTLGFVNELTQDGGAVAGALELAAQIAACSPTSVTSTLAAMHAVDDDYEVAGWTATARGIDEVVGSDNQLEGVAAFFERRAPRWV